MKKFFRLATLVLVFAASVFSQDPSPRPTPPPTSDSEVVKISTNLVQLDVTVTDSKGRVITDLRPEEIEIYENGKRQKTTNFSFISNVRAQSVKAPETKLTPGFPPPPVRPENVRRTIALVVDDLSLSFSSMVWVRDALKKFVNEQMQDGDLVAIVQTGSGIGSMQQFTTDKRVLLAAIQKVKFNMLGTGKSGSFSPIVPTFKEQLNGDERFSEDIEKEREFDKEVNEFREAVFATGTLGSINYVIQGMMDLPGRKSIMLLSDGLSFVERDRNGSPILSTRLVGPLRNLTDLANRASVVIYSIDARGLEFTGATAADDTYGLTTAQIDQRLSDRDNEFHDTQDGLITLSRATGGFALINQNDISRGIRKILDDQSYYLVGYEPDDDTFDPKRIRYNSLAVKVLRKDARVRYRSGFYGFSDEQRTKVGTSPTQALANALRSPFSVNDITLRLNALFAGSDKQAGYLRSILHIDTNGLTFVDEPGGKHKTTFDLIAMTFGENGLAKDRITKTYAISINDDAFQKLQKTGLVYDFMLSVKNPGAYQMRVAIRDTATNRVGSANQFVDVPNLKKNRISLSGVFVENTTLAEWQKRDAAAANASYSADTLTDTAVRQFRPGTVLNYATNVFNARPDGEHKINITTQAKLFGDQTLVFEGKPFSHTQAAGGPESVLSEGSIQLGGKLPAGNYTLQLLVTDNNAREGRNVAVQYVSFEIVR